MSLLSPKLSMREIRRHPDVITEPADLQPGLEVALCYFMPPVGRGVRSAQALMGLLGRAEQDSSTRREAMRQGYRHTPTWGIIVQNLATVNWVITTNNIHKYPYVSFNVTQSAVDLSPADKLSNPATSVEGIGKCLQELPAVNMGNIILGEQVHEFELIKGFEDIGLAPDPFGLNPFVLDLTN